MCQTCPLFYYINGDCVIDKKFIEENRMPWLPLNKHLWKNINSIDSFPVMCPFYFLKVV